MANRLRYTLSLRVFGEEKIFGPGIAELLERVDETHSLRKGVAHRQDRRERFGVSAARFRRGRQGRRRRGPYGARAAVSQSVPDV